MLQIKKVKSKLNLKFGPFQRKEKTLFAAISDFFCPLPQPYKSIDLWREFAELSKVGDNIKRRRIRLDKRIRLNESIYRREKKLYDHPEMLALQKQAIRFELKVLYLYVKYLTD